MLRWVLSGCDSNYSDIGFERRMELYILQPSYASRSFTNLSSRRFNSLDIEDIVTQVSPPLYHVGLIPSILNILLFIIKW